MGVSDGRPTVDHIIQVDLIAAVQDPSASKLDPDGPAATLLESMNRAVGYRNDDTPPVVIVRLAGC